MASPARAEGSGAVRTFGVWPQSIGAALTLAGFGLVWWAIEQFGLIQLIAGSEFRYPEARFLGWILTLVAAGLVFGLAITRGGRLAVARRAIAVFSALPALVLAWAYSAMALGWSPFQPSFELVSVLMSQQMLIVSAVVLGFFVSALLGPARGGHSS